jgi:hypothetical protein
MDRLFSQNEAAALLHLSPRTLQRRRADRSGPPFVRLGRRICYRAADLEMWVAANITTPQPATTALQIRRASPRGAA